MIEHYNKRILETYCIVFVSLVLVNLAIVAPIPEGLVIVLGLLSVALLVTLLILAYKAATILKHYGLIKAHPTVCTIAIVVPVVGVFVCISLAVKSTKLLKADPACNTEQEPTNT